MTSDNYRFFKNCKLLIEVKNGPWEGAIKDLLTIIRESWNHFDKEHCLKIDFVSYPARVEVLVNRIKNFALD